MNIKALIALFLLLVATPIVAFAEDAHLFDDLDGDGISDSHEEESAAQGSADDGSVPTDGSGSTDGSGA